MRRPRLLTVLALLVAARAAAAQDTSGVRVGVVTGVVRDSATQRGARRSSVCITIPAGPGLAYVRCSAVDSAGAYRIDSLPSMELQLSVACSTIRGLGALLGSARVHPVDSVAIRRDFLVGTSGCDPRPVRRVVGTFRGHYYPGFESSDFVPCPADGWFIAGDSLGAYPFSQRRAWVEWLPGVGRGLKWPDAPRNSYGTRSYYVRWHGTVVGPGSYGHMGVSAFELRVDTLLEVRVPGKRDCEGR